MKKEDFQNVQPGDKSDDNKKDNREQEKSLTNSISSQYNANLQAGLGRYRMTGIEDSEDTAGRDDQYDTGHQNAGSREER